MKRLQLFLSFTLLLNSLFSQTTDGNKRTIEVVGYAEIEVVPDEIYYSVELKEYKIGKEIVKLDRLERKFWEIIDKLELAKDRVSLDKTYSRKYQIKRKKEEVFKTKSYIMTNTSKLTIHMVSSLDGFIAKKDGSVSWLQSNDNYEKGITLTEAEIEEFLKNIDCYVMGARTYEHALELGWPYGDVPVIVLTHRELPAKRDSIEFYSGDLNKLVNDQLKPHYQNIWMVGGATLTKEFIRQKLADEIIISIMPIILGDGILFFDYIGQEQLLHLKDVKAYKDGMVELCYEVKKNGNLK